MVLRRTRAALKQNQTQKNEVQDKRSERKKEHRLWQQTYIQIKAVQTSESTRITRSMTKGTAFMAELMSLARAFNAEANMDGDPLTYREATEGP